MSATVDVRVHKSFAGFMASYQRDLNAFHAEMTKKLPPEDCAAFRKMLARMVAKWEMAVLPPRVRGEQHHLAVLTEKDVREIRSKYKPGTTVRKLAQQYGVSPGTIHRVVSQKSWRHLLNKQGD